MLARPRQLLAPLLVLATLAAPCDASIAPGARSIIDAYLEATGGRAAFEAERSLRVKGTIAARGLTGTFESHYLHPDKVHTSVRLGTLRFESGFDGSVAWRTETGSRKVVVLEGEARADAIADAYFQNELWARPDQGGGAVTLGGKAVGNDGVQQALDVAPPHGRTRRLWFSEKTGHLVRIATPRDGGEWVERHSDYRRSANRVRAHASESGFARAAATYQRFTVDSAWANDAIDSTRFAPPPSALGSMRRAERRRAFPGEEPARAEPEARNRDSRRTPRAAEPAWDAPDGGSRRAPPKVGAAPADPQRCSCGAYRLPGARPAGCRRCT